MRNKDNVIHAEIPKNEICAPFQISSSLELTHPVNSNNETWATSYVQCFDPYEGLFFCWWKQCLACLRANDGRTREPATSPAAFRAVPD